MAFTGLYLQHGDQALGQFGEKFLGTDFSPRFVVLRGLIEEN